MTVQAPQPPSAQPILVPVSCTDLVQDIPPFHLLHVCLFGWLDGWLFICASKHVMLLLLLFPCLFTSVVG